MSDRTATVSTPPAPSAAERLAATEASIATYVESWNETDPARRQAASLP